MRPTATQGRGSAMLLAATLLMVACAGRGTVAPPSSPEATVRRFMNAVKANSVSAMSELWGSARGPARNYMGREEMEQRLTIIRTYLQHEQFEIVEPQAGLPAAAAGRRSVQVRLTRNGCTPVVPFALVPYGGGWLVTEIDLNAAGNPRRSCAPPQ